MDKFFIDHVGGSLPSSGDVEISSIIPLSDKKYKEHKIRLKTTKIYLLTLTHGALADQCC